ncbi:MAG: hypothetical protein ACO3FN_06250, partial [Vulcanococcus sp.]
MSKVKLARSAGCFTLSKASKATNVPAAATISNAKRAEPPTNAAPGSTALLTKELTRAINTATTTPAVSQR